MARQRPPIEFELGGGQVFVLVICMHSLKLCTHQIAFRAACASTGLCIYRDVSGSSSSVFPTLRTCCLGGHAGIANRCAPQGVSLGSCLEIVCPPFQDLCSTCDRATQVCLHDPGPGGNSPTDSVQCGKCVSGERGAMLLPPAMLPTIYRLCGDCQFDGQFGRQVYANDL